MSVTFADNDERRVFTDNAGGLVSILNPVRTSQTLRVGPLSRLHFAIAVRRFPTGVRKYGTGVPFVHPYPALSLQVHIRLIGAKVRGMVGLGGVGAVPSVLGTFYSTEHSVRDY